MDKLKKASPGHMAWLVGEALRAGGIQIHQTKEKFGGIRIYVGVPNNHESRMHYREVYLYAMDACPDLAANLFMNADYREWLYRTEEELDAAIAKVAASGGEASLAAWDPRFQLARKLIRGEDTSDYLDGDTEYEVVSEPSDVTCDRELFEAAHAAVGWACVQNGGGEWIEIHRRMSDALKPKEKKR